MDAPSTAQYLAELDAIFAALDSPVRRRILSELHFRGERMAAGEIVERFLRAWPTTSRHLRKLEYAGLVVVERAGREWIYALNRERFRIPANWLDWFVSARMRNFERQRR